MGCLIYKESKLNALDLFKKGGFLTETREILNQSEFDKEHAAFITDVNRIYNLNLEELFKKEEVSVSKFGIKSTPYNRSDSRINISRAVPIEENFKQIDDARKALGIYDSQESIGEYRQRMGLTNKITPPTESPINNEETDIQAKSRAEEEFKKGLNNGEPDGFNQICN